MRLQRLLAHLSKYQDVGLGYTLESTNSRRTAQAQARDGGLLGGHGADGAAPGAHVQRQHRAHHRARLYEQHAPPAKQPQRLLLQVALAARLRTPPRISPCRSSHGTHALVIAYRATVNTKLAPKRTDSLLRD